MENTEFVKLITDSRNKYFEIAGKLSRDAAMNEGAANACAYILSELEAQAKKEPENIADGET